MPIATVVPTTDSNVVKITLKNPLSVSSGTFTAKSCDNQQMQSLLTIEGLEQVVVNQLELLLTRDPNLDWGSILDEIRRVLK